MLGDVPVMPALPAVDLARARRWYAEKLGLEPEQEPPAALLYRVASGQLMLFASDSVVLLEHQVAAWRVTDIDAEVAELSRRGVEFLVYDTDDLKTVDGIARTPAGRAAWFRDSEGNLLTLVEVAAAP